MAPAAKYGLHTAISGAANTEGQDYGPALRRVKPTQAISRASLPIGKTTRLGHASQVSAPFDEPLITLTMATPDGPFSIVVADRAVVAASWTDTPSGLCRALPESWRERRLVSASTHEDSTQAAVAAVSAYYDDDFSAIINVNVRQFGTDFQREGWRVLRQIPAGSPLSYAGLAEHMGRPRAVRAAAAVCARNTVALFVPCHRVIRSDGSLGGFGPGETIKRSLLARESD